MSILPSFAVEAAEEDTSTEEEVIATPEEYGIDFETGQLTGRRVTGIEAIKVWIYLCLKCPRYYYPIYSWDYGVELEVYVGKTATQEFLDTDLRKEVEDALRINPYIARVSAWEATRDGSRVHIVMTVETDLGDTEVDDYV